MTKILIIEDETALRESIMEMLHFTSFEVMGTGSGSEGLRMVQQQHPDLILCDIMMPDVTGDKVLKQIRSNPDTATIPFIFLTAIADRENIRYGMELGADDYITKPFTTHELLNAIEARLKRHQEIMEESEHQLEDLKQQLARMVTHELRTPLVSINTMLDVISRQSGQLSPEELDELLGVIREGSQRLSHRVEQLTFLTQIQTGILSQSIIDGKGLTMPLWDLLVASTNLARRFVYRPQSDVFLNMMDVQREADVVCNPAALKHAFAELIANAITFSPEGGEVKIVQKVADGAVRISITDRGQGIADDKMSAALETFGQVDRKEREQQGIGMGLSLAQRIVGIHGGKIELRSVVGKGTQVLVYLPLAKSEALEHRLN